MPSSGQGFDAGQAESALRALRPSAAGVVADLGSQEDWYLDGIEESLLEILGGARDLASTNADLVRMASTDVEAYHLDAARANVVRALTIDPSMAVLEVGAGCGAVTRYLGETARLVDAIEPTRSRAEVAAARCRDLETVRVFAGDAGQVPAVPTYDLIVVVGVLEYVGHGSADLAPYLAFLRSLRGCLRDGGTIALAIENKLGVKYLAGAHEDHTDRSFDSLEDYPHGGRARTFSRRELEGLFLTSGLSPRTLGLFPDYKLTRVVQDYSAHQSDEQSLLWTIPVFPSKDPFSQRPKLVSEAALWRSLVSAGVAGEFPNSFLVLATNNGSPSTLWPEGTLDVFFSVGRKERFSLVKRVRRHGDNLVVDSDFVGRRPESRGSVWVNSGTSQFVRGVDLSQVAESMSIDQIREFLRLWELQLDRIKGAKEVPLDCAPYNAVVRSDGSLEFIDQEWLGSDCTLEQIKRRGVFWFATRLAQNVAPEFWVGCSTIRDVMEALASGLDLGDQDRWVDIAIEEESELAVIIRSGWLGTGDVTPLDYYRASHREMVNAPLSALPLGTRDTEQLARVSQELVNAQARVDDAEARADGAARSIDDLLGELESARSGAALTIDELRTELALARSRAEAERETGTDRHDVVTRTEGPHECSRPNEATVQGMLDRAERAEAEVAMYRGYSWVAMGRAWAGIVDRVAPRGTVRRKLYGRGGRVLRAAVARLRRSALEEPAWGASSVGRAEAQDPLTALAVASSAKPRVSIVIPVFGHWEHTEACIRAIASCPDAVPYEVVVVDDASTDDSLSKLRLVGGVRIIALDSNLGFVGACNAGIAEARGELVVLLNNDTEVQPGWLTAMVAAFDDPQVGLVGARLVYPDGRLQEAGGIIFSDASGWNYGRLGDPEAHAFTYRRDVDYCSGAAIVVRREILTTLGGLDTFYAPAYYEDTDLAFAVRELGYRVIYEPRATVVHNEGVSHGTDETAGVKRFQVINHSKFREKWKSQLATQVDPDPENVEWAARRRSSPRGIVVVIDHYAPHPDEDSGSVRMMRLLETLKGLGFGVIFVPDNRHRDGRYGQALADLGIEVFYGGEDLWAFLGKLRSHIVAVIAARVTVAQKYLLDHRATLPGVPFIFDTVDLHYLRLQREAELEGVVGETQLVTSMRETELGLIRSSDMTLVVSTAEQAMLGRVVPGADVAVVSNVHVLPDLGHDTVKRDTVVFVGSFSHPPNTDGLRWFFTEVAPQLDARRPGVHIEIVGKNPDPCIDAIATETTKLLGWVEDLSPVYGRAKVAIAPLRYGAGVKGKVGEALSYGVPVVTTSIGAEGMGLVHGETAMIADTADEFADALYAVLTDQDLWNRLSVQGRAHIDAVLGVEAFTRSVRDVLASVRPGIWAD